MMVNWEGITSLGEQVMPEPRCCVAWIDQRRLDIWDLFLQEEIGFRQ